MPRPTYCGYCGQRGHNRRTCPTLKASENKELAANPDSLWSKSIRSQRSAAKRSNSTRRCSYCEQTGHNRRSCPTLKNDRIAVQSAFTDYRKRFAENLKKSGLGVGAIVKVPVRCSRVCDSYYVGLVTEMHWDVITHLYETTNLYNNFVTPQECRFASMKVIKIIEGKDKSHRQGWRTIEEGDKVWLDVRQIADSLPEIFPAYAATERNASVEWSSEILAPAGFVRPPEQYYSQEINQYVEGTYRFATFRGQQAWEKQRRRPGIEFWTGIYHSPWKPEEKISEAS